MSIINHHFLKAEPFPELQSDTRYDLDAMVLGFMYPDPDTQGTPVSTGVCGHGAVSVSDSQDIDKAFLDTAAGDYDPNHDACKP